MQAQFNKNVDSRMIYVANEENGLMMSIYLDKAPNKGDANAGREYHWKYLQTNPLKRDDVKMSSFRGMPMLEYIVKEVQNTKIDQKNYFAFMSKDDIWMYIHLSKVQFVPEDQKLFEDVLQTARINEDFTPTIRDNYLFGNAFYYIKKYADAVIYYNKALE